MDPFEAGMARATFETFPCPEPILEVGSYQVDGQEQVANLRRFLPGRCFVGTDLRHGPGVDAVANVESLPYRNHSFGTVIALNLFEHVPRFWLGFQEAQRVLRTDGLLIISCPFYFRIHSFPSDYWRFTPEAFRLMLEKMPSKIIGYHGPTKRPLNVWAVAAAPDYPVITEEQHVKFRERIRLYARQPLSWDKRVRYRMGQLICGRRPFSIFFEAENFDTMLIGTRPSGI
jgi:SAM-dependent methyltransferase